MDQPALRRAALRVISFVLLFAGAAAAASAYEVLDNNKLRFGTGAEASVNTNGNLQQPFYWDAALNGWYKLTYSNYPLDNAIAIGGDGTQEWNTNGTLLVNSPLANQTLDVSGFTLTAGSKGYGTIVSTGTITIDGKTLQMRNTYTLDQNASFVRITTRITNTSGAGVTNLRVWVGTRDDWVGTSDGPTKQRGNLTGGQFVPLTNQANRAAALQITSGQSGVLFYSTSPKAHTSVNYCCNFANAYNQNPATSAIQLGGDGSYALFVRMDDLANGASEEFTWYYAAGEVANLGNIAGEVSQGSGGSPPQNWTVTASAGTGGTLSPGNATVTNGATTAFTITPSAGYSIDSVQGCGGSRVGNTYTTGAVTANCTVTASFRLNTYTVTASAGAGGSLSPGNVTVNHGSTTNFTVTPSTGYSIGTVQGCDGSLSGNTFTTGAVTGACAVTATFVLNTYAVTATAGENGAISSNGAPVDHGGNASFTITPALGYSIGQISGCGGGSLNGNIYTTTAVTGACSISVQFVQTRPAFNPSAPAEYELQATALMTPLPQSIAPVARDYQGETLAVTLEGGATLFEPGEHLLTWRAVDHRGVVGTVQQVLRVWPIVSMGKDVSLGFHQGNSGSVRIALNGRSPVYPFHVDYTVTGYSQGHDLQNGTAVFEDGETQKDIYFAVLQTAQAGSPGQEMRMTIDEGVNRGMRREAVVTLVTANAAPVVTVSGQQDGAAAPVFARAGGQITLIADVQDPNSNDTHTLQWTAPNGAVTVVQNGRLLVTANSLPVGVHRFQVVATDNGSPVLSSRGVFDLVLREAAMALPQGVQAWADNGLPDDPAYNPVTPNILPERSGELHHYIVESDPGVKLRLGPNALLIGQAQAELEDMTSILGADTIANVGGYFDFIVDNLPQPGQSANVVLPQRAPIPQNPAYRKFNTASQRWQTFVVDGSNSLASAPGAAGHCPPPSSSEYRPGLNAGDWCVRLTISDGGPNDDDGQVNGSISDPGGIAAMASVVVTGTSSGSGGGGGSMDLLLLVLGVSLLALRKGFPRHLRAVVLMSALATPALASAESSSLGLNRWYFGGDLGEARGEVTGADINARLTAEGYDVTATYDDRTRSAWRIFIGYEWNRYVEARLGYTELGEAATTYAGNVIDIQEFLQSANRLQPHSANGVELSLVGRYPLMERLSVFWRGGVFRWDSDYSSSDAGSAFARLKDSGADGFFGMGMEIAVRRGVNLNAEWNRYTIDREDVDFAGLGLVYRFGN